VERPRTKNYIITIPPENISGKYKRGGKEILNEVLAVFMKENAITNA